MDEGRENTRKEWITASLDHTPLGTLLGPCGFRWLGSDNGDATT